MILAIHGGEPITTVRSDINHEILLETLFRGRAWPPGWGLHVGCLPGAQLQGEAPLGYESATSPDGSAWQVMVTMGVLELRVTLCTPDGLGPNFVQQPGGLCLRSRVVPGIDCSPLPGPMLATRS
jgi:hypothetical protein